MITHPQRYLRLTIISQNLHQEEENLKHSRSSRWFDWDSNQVPPACKSRALPLHYPALFYSVREAVVSIFELFYFVACMFNFQRQKIFSCNDGTKANVTFTSEVGSEPPNKWTEVADCCVMFIPEALYTLRFSTMLTRATAVIDEQNLTQTTTSLTHYPLRKEFQTAVAIISIEVLGRNFQNINSYVEVVLLNVCLFRFYKMFVFIICYLLNSSILNE
jgi:hypothetical protein